MQSADAFRIVVIPPGGRPDAGLTAAACGGGAEGVVDLEFAREPEAAARALHEAAGTGNRGLGMKVWAEGEALWTPLLDRLPSRLSFVILSFASTRKLGARVKQLKARGLEVRVEIHSLEEALAAEKAGADTLIAKGQEAAGWVGEATTFVLLQEVLEHVALPVLAQGGIGVHSAAACRAAGASGVVLDWQAALLRESGLPDPLRGRIHRLDGREAVCLSGPGGLRFRGHIPGLGKQRGASVLPEAGTETDWIDAVHRRVAEADAAARLWPMSQDTAFAGRLAAKYRTVGGLVRAIRRSLVSHVRAAGETAPLAEGHGSAAMLGMRYPVIQGPMSRVSDTPAFAAAVAEAGGLPVMAGAMMDPEAELRPMLEETRAVLGDRPWGIGLLGFIQPEMYNRQVEIVKAVRPPVAVIAGGNPRQAAELEEAGIAAYIHVQSTALLALYIEEGTRRFVFEGRECGGHIGPYAASVLWDNAVETLLATVNPDDAPSYDIWFAGGIHDAVSGAMLSALAAPLAARGFHVGVLIGTAYLLTDEAVASGAITEAYRQRLLQAAGTAILDSGGGYEVRTAPCPFTEQFVCEKARLAAEGKPAAEIREALEMLNLGRLRIAAKGVRFNLKYLDDPTQPMTLSVPGEEQAREGVFMAGQAIALHDRPKTVADLHETVCGGGTRRVSEPAPARVTAEGREPACGVAIVGMSGVFPGAGDTGAYWENILNKHYAIREVPPERWDWRAYFDETPGTQDKIYSRWGGFIDPVEFDPLAFKIPPNALKAIDPLQLFPLVVTRAALEDAGYLARPFDRERAGVIFGVAGGMGDLGLMYGFRALLPLFFKDPPRELLAQLPEWTEDSFPGILANVVAGRIANSFDLGGANYTVDAACGSGLTAVYAGVREILNGASDMMVVGASDVMQNPFGFLCFAQTRALTPSGRPRPFDASSDGISIGEGIAAVVLKRLDLAEEDGDRIYAVIRGVGASSDGQGASMTAPQTRGQTRAIRRAYEQCHFGLSQVELIEAHGTGTRLGDGVEAETLYQALRREQARPGVCAVGTVKSMIGHTKGTAGIAGLIKTALALYHKVLPPTLGIEHPAPESCWAEDSPIYLNGDARPWIRHNGPRRAG
ncbi:MAG: nitronate monooxygenase, partial [Lentisphaerae bacterium]|nr:nitronate monooxygenase [Lentisphaerota bacterium]